MGNNLNAQEAYQSKKIRLAKFGLFIAWISAITYPIYQNFNVAATSRVYNIAETVHSFIPFDSGILTTYLVTLVLLAMCEFTGGVLVVLFTLFRGAPLREYRRLWETKSSRIVLVSAFSAGPVATACIVMGVNLAGSTYANIILSLTTVIIAIAGQIFLKENLNARVYVGIIIVIAGCILASYAPPVGVKNFYLGIIVTLIATIGFTVEAMVSTQAMDVTEPLEVCGLYRMIGGGIMEILIAIIFGAATGHLDLIAQTLRIVAASPLVALFIFLTACAMTFQYGCGYLCYNYCGAVRGSVIIYTTPIWSIPLGYLFSAMGILPYHVTPVAIIGSFVVVIGVILVLCKPSELFNLRNI